jgi:hypothetical protein
MITFGNDSGFCPIQSGAIIHLKVFVICDKACIPGQGFVGRKRIEPDEKTSSGLGYCPFSASSNLKSNRRRGEQNCNRPRTKDPILHIC